MQVVAAPGGDALLARGAPPEAMRRMNLASGSMGPKVEAACRFAEQSGHAAIIGSLADAERLLDIPAGTTIARELPALEWPGEQA